MGRHAKTTDPCTFCGATEDVSFITDPYAAELADDHTPTWICSPCEEQRALDV